MIDGVSYTYGSGTGAVSAVRDVSLTIRRGEVVVFIGPSGSGKTTLLQIVGALLTPMAGSVSFEGQRLDELDESGLCEFRRRRCGFIFQSYNLLPNLCAWENVAIARELQGSRLRRAEAQSRALLDYVGLQHRANAYPDQLSGGEKQRVAIARAVAGNPDVILADEPTAALDAIAGARIAELLKTLASRHDRAVIVVTHDPRLTAIGDRIVMLEDGRIASVTDMPAGPRHGGLPSSLLNRMHS
jgi:putative ABC transport system ATP-binding protein